MAAKKKPANKGSPSKAKAATKKQRLLGIPILGQVVRMVDGQAVAGVVLQKTDFTRLANAKAKAASTISALRTHLKTAASSQAKELATLREALAKVEDEEIDRTRQLGELQVKFDNLQSSKNLLLRKEEVRQGKVIPDGTKSTADYNSVTTVPGFKRRVPAGLAGLNKK